MQFLFSRFSRQFHGHEAIFHGQMHTFSRSIFFRIWCDFTSCVKKWNCTLFWERENTFMNVKTFSWTWKHFHEHPLEAKPIHPTYRENGYGFDWCETFWNSIIWVNNSPVAIDKFLFAPQLASQIISIRPKLSDLWSSSPWICHVQRHGV